MVGTSGIFRQPFGARDPEPAHLFCGRFCFSGLAADGGFENLDHVLIAALPCMAKGGGAAAILDLDLGSGFDTSASTGSDVFLLPLPRTTAVMSAVQPIALT